MGEPKMELGKRELEKIGEYVKSHLPQWLDETGATDAPKKEGERAAALRKRELDILERVVRVEDELKNLSEVMEERFGRMDKRFEAMQNQMDERFDHVEKHFEALQNQMDRRFEEQQKQMDRRFDIMQKHMDKRFFILQWTVSAGFIIIAALIGIPLIF